MIIALAAYGLFRIRWRLSARVIGVRPPQYSIGCQRQLRIPMRDGCTLVADHYFPVMGAMAAGATRREPFPTIVIRSPYGRDANAGAFGQFLVFFARGFARRGYHVLVQDTRGRFDSGGEWLPYFNEKNDGLDTLKWLETRSWFSGAVGLWGPSYLGIVQWAIAAESPHIRAMVPIVTSSQLQSIVYPDGALDLGLIVRWMSLFQAIDRKRNQPLYRSVPLLWEIDRSIAPAFSAPIREADRLVLGHEVDYYRKWLDNTGPESPLWQQLNDATDATRVQAPVHLVGGWYDFFLRGTLNDYQTLKQAGRQPYLTIGPWYHFSPSNPMVMIDGFKESVAWFDAHLKNDRRYLRRKPVRITVMGSGEVRDLDDWPPPARATRLYLHCGGQLHSQCCGPEEGTTHYIYDPRNPTPALGGAQFSMWAGPKDNRPLEARPDVLTFTTAPLAKPLEVIGHPRLDLYVRSSLEYTDFFGRLCDVYPDGRSVNICDGLFRVVPGKGLPQPDGSIMIQIDLWATAHQFRVGHCLRLQVSSGAHPHWTRNPGTGTLDAAEMHVASQTIYHDAQRPSALVLPVTGQVDRKTDRSASAL